MSLSFKPVLMEKVLTGEKTVTRRAWPTSYKHGQIVSIVPGMGRIACGKVRIVSVEPTTIDWFDDAEAQREGFNNHDDFALYWLRLHGSFDMNGRFARIEFELVEVTRTICQCCGGIGTHAVAPQVQGRVAGPYSFTRTAEAHDNGEYVVWWRFNGEPFLCDTYPDAEGADAHAGRLTDEFNRAHARGSEG